MSSADNEEFNSASFAEKELVKLLKKLDPWNSGFWKVHLEKVKQEAFDKGYNFAIALNPPKKNPLGIEILD